MLLPQSKIFIQLLVISNLYRKENISQHKAENKSFYCFKKLVIQ